MLTGAQMKALGQMQQRVGERAFNAYANGLQNSLNPYADAAAMLQAQSMQASAAAASINTLLGIKPMAYEPKPEPKGPPDVWHWLAYLEDTGGLRWWHLIWALVIDEKRPLSEPENLA